MFRCSCCVFITPLKFISANSSGIRDELYPVSKIVFRRNTHFTTWVQSKNLLYQFLVCVYREPMIQKLVSFRMSFGNKRIYNIFLPLYIIYWVYSCYLGRSNHCHLLVHLQEIQILVLVFFMYLILDENSDIIIKGT